jgi:hypothetical protein
MYASGSVVLNPQVCKVAGHVGITNGQKLNEEERVTFCGAIFTLSCVECHCTIFG